MSVAGVGAVSWNMQPESVPKKSAPILRAPMSLPPANRIVGPLSPTSPGRSPQGAFSLPPSVAATKFVRDYFFFVKRGGFTRSGATARRAGEQGRVALTGVNPPPPHRTGQLRFGEKRRPALWGLKALFGHLPSDHPSGSSAASRRPRFLTAIRQGPTEQCRPHAAKADPGPWSTSRIAAVIRLRSGKT
jgi:hypothetical protein